MSSASICASCLSRLRISGPLTSRLPTTVLPASALFSTTAVQQNVIKKKTNAPTQLKFREARAARIKKKTREKPRPPVQGERRTQRKRIVLSNTNALEVSGLEQLSPENMADTAKVGQMLALNGTLLDQLRDSKSFKTTQNWSMFRQPSTLMRLETCELGQDIKEVMASQQDQGFGALTIQKIVTGERGSGKSIHLLQAQSMAFLNGWVVVNIPECQDFVINTSSYAPVAPGEDRPTAQDQPALQLYSQPQLASQLLSRVVSSNAKVLQSLKLTHQPSKNLPFKPTKTSTLFSLAEVGVNDPQVAPAIFNAFWKELTQPGPAAASNDKAAQRPPVLVTIDGLNHWMGPSLYRNSEYGIIHAHQFTLVRHFLSLLFPQQQTDNGSGSFASGGMVLAATSGSNSPDHASFRLLLHQLEALQSSSSGTTKKMTGNLPLPAPFSKIDQSVLDLVKGGSTTTTGLVKLKGLTKAESKGLLEYFARSGVLRERVTEHFVGERWSLSGGGVVGELAKLGRRVRI